VFDHIGVIAKPGDPRVGGVLEQLVAQVDAMPRQLWVDAASITEFPAFANRSIARKDLGSQCDLAIIIGGDGTFLSAARSLAGCDISLVGINMGRLGFLTDISPEEMTQALAQIFSGRFRQEERFLLRAAVHRNREVVAEEVALNDVVAHKGHIARLLQFETFVDSKLVSSQRSDGLIVSTPTGSTAYALSSGGPILHPPLDAMVLVPICPHTLSTRPIVVGGDSDIEIVLRTHEEPNAQLICDGQMTAELACGDRIRIRKHERPLRLIHPPGHDYFTTLRTKLNWGKEV
jgi:NAD+ kinase